MERKKERKKERRKKGKKEERKDGWMEERTGFIPIIRDRKQN